MFLTVTLPTEDKKGITMKRKDFIILGLCVAMVLTLIISLLLLTGQGKNSNQNKPHEHGTIIIKEEVVEEENEELFYEASPGELIAPIKRQVVIYNSNILYDLITLEAIKQLEPNITNFLDHHGFSNVNFLKIDENSIIKEKAYPYFVCTMFNANETPIENKKIEARYHLEDYQWEFAIIEK